MTTPHRQKRRMSVDDANAELLGHVHSTVDRLSTLWDRIAMDRETREKRTQAAYQLFYNTMNEIVGSEEEMVNNVEKDIQRELPEIQSTLKELGLPEFNVSKFVPNSIALFKALKHEKADLVAKKKAAMERQLKEYEKLVKICSMLDEPVPNYDSITEKIAHRSVVDEMQRKRIELDGELENRRNELHKLQGLANRRNTIVKNITLEPVERDLLSLDMNSSGFVVSKSLIDNFKSLIDKFDAEYEKWRENIEFQFTELYVELKELAEKCYAHELLSAYPESIDLDAHDPEIVNNLRDDIEKLKRRYESGKELFDSFQQWYLAFKKLEEVDAELNTDKARQNRGGIMAKLLEKQKRLRKDAEKSLRELEAECSKDKNLDITIEGRTPHQQALWLVQLREQQKENDKAMKKVAKAKQLQEEARFGTSVVGSPTKSVLSACTPRKRPIQTPTSGKPPKSLKFTDQSLLTQSDYTN
ncbi:Protein regulator of cytokinesis 1-like isoform X3 [Aphelenchoides besseyi]|nr:Protein regulator of cytokinesis 1-like isoform X3 [Aphelenchoides besseyi]